MTDLLARYHACTAWLEEIEPGIQRQATLESGDYLRRAAKLQGIIDQLAAL